MFCLVIGLSNICLTFALQYLICSLLQQNTLSILILLCLSEIAEQEVTYTNEYFPSDIYNCLMIIFNEWVASFHVPFTFLFDNRIQFIQF
jgi:hypothetical protein